MASGMLASLRNYRPNRKKTPSKSPFSLGKRSDPGSPSAYGSQVFDIGESSYEERDLDPTSSVGRIYEVPKSLPPEPVVSPRVDVDIEQTPADWFPSHFLKTDSIAGPSSLAAAANTIAATAPKTKSVETFDNDAGSEGEEDEEDEDDDDLSISTGEEFVANLESMDASNFLSLPPSDPSTLPSVIAARKPAPTPIKIPNASLHGPRVQLVRSATAQSRPESMFSLDGASAVSGTTLARALIGDSFVLSADRSSRYRSGASVLTRSDSATLPRGEHPFSPAWSARRSGAFTPIDSMGKPIPPVPQMPEELRALIAESRDRLKVGGSGSGAGSDGGSASPGTPLVRSNSGRVLLSADPAVGAEGEDEDGADRASRRISRISEAPTPTSSLPFTPNDPPDTAETSPDPASSSSHAPEPPVTPASTAQNFHHPAPSPSAFPASPGQSSTSDTRSSRDLDNVLDYYNFENSPYSSGPGQSMFDLPSPEPGAEGGMGGAMANGMRYHPAFSPITEESGSQLSPNSFRSRRTPSGVGTLASTPSPSTGSGRVEWRPGESQTIRSLPPHPQSATATLLPIGGDRRGSGSVRLLLQN
ncbi:hypothetical protein C8R46DRAFT_301463 [Mycena filopes]|nr:hypothetical protein C8R46DRAFT_301463 [Mycena filopes]